MNRLTPQSFAFLILIVENLSVFCIYATDKWRAIHHRWRISEATLLWLALLGGGLGAYLAGILVHHKTRKYYFWIIWLLGLIIDFVIVVIITK